MKELNFIAVQPKLVVLLCMIVALSHCRKEGKGCWQAFDPQGYDAAGLVVCDKTKAEAEAAYPQFWFYRAGETKYCWKVEVAGRTAYAWDVPESMAKRHMAENGAYHFSRTDCASFCHCEWHEKHKSKITGNFGPVRVFPETILSADSCRKLSVGKVVVVRETADSFITRELVSKNP